MSSLIHRLLLLSYSSSSKGRGLNPSHFRRRYKASGSGSGSSDVLYFFGMVWFGGIVGWFIGSLQGSLEIKRERALKQERESTETISSSAEW